MVLFFKIFFFFFIGNLFLGTMISILANDPNIACPAQPILGCPNPNTTFFAERGITGSNVTDPDVDSFYKSQFPVGEGPNGVGTGPPNATSPLNSPNGFVQSIQEFVSFIDVFNIQEMVRFLSFINPFYTFDAMGELFNAIGVPFDAGFLLAFKAIFLLLGILAFIFVVFKIDVI